MIKRLWANHRKLTIAFVLAVTLALAFTVRAVFLFPFDFNPHLPVEAWMTPRFIIHTYPIDPEQLGPLLGLPKGSDPHKTLKQIAADKGIPAADLIARLQTVIDQKNAAFEAEHGAPPRD